MPVTMVTIAAVTNTISIITTPFLSREWLTACPSSKRVAPTNYYIRTNVPFQAFRPNFQLIFYQKHKIRIGCYIINYISNLYIISS